MGYLFLGEKSTAALRARTAGFAAAMSGVFGLVKLTGRYTKLSRADTDHWNSTIDSYSTIRPP